MTQLHGKYACGHKGSVIVSGMRSRSEFNRDCPACFEKSFEQQKEIKNEKAKLQSKELNLPELTGSAKQISWANTLRHTMYEKFEIAIQNPELFIKEYRGVLPKALLSLTKEDFAKIRDFILMNRKSASYYIENRHRFLDYIEQEYENVLRKSI